MAGEIALDSSAAIRFLNGESRAVRAVRSANAIVLPLAVVGELLFGAMKSAQSARNIDLLRDFVSAATTRPLTVRTAELYAEVKLGLSRKGQPIPENDVWIASQCLEYGWTLLHDDRHFEYVDGLAQRRIGNA